MTTLFCVRPVTRNVGNDMINRATTDLLFSVFGADTNIVTIPALAGPQNGGLTASQVYDINRLADGVVIGGGNLFENGQLTVDQQALSALGRPLLLLGLSHGRIYSRDGSLVHRTDAMPPQVIRLLVEKSIVTIVRDHGTQEILRGIGIPNIKVGGCPTLFMASNRDGVTSDGPMQHDERVLISLRQPERMSIPPPRRHRVADDVRRLIAALNGAFRGPIVLACHDYADLEFAAAFPDTPFVYFDDVDRYVEALRQCRLNVTYRLHAFLPCLAFGTPSIHLSYDERGREAVATAGMGEWDIDMVREPDVVDAVMSRTRQIERYHALREHNAAAIAGLRETTMAGLQCFAKAVTQGTHHG
jgi:polysaccharide pyruvyl transferase WcaK-like protein